jgi:uncharacterized protein (DUF1501 family)
MLSRRQFLAASVGVAGVVVSASALDRALRGAGGHASGVRVVGPPSTTAAPASTSPPTSAPAPAGQHVLVVVQFGGGNDGLNTLVPTAGSYHDVRGPLAIDPAQLVALPGAEGFGLHPAMAPLRDRLAAGQVALLEAIGFEHPDRSHFAASDAWWSATPGQASATGWLGRALDAMAGTAVPDPLLAVGLGGSVPSLVGQRARPTVVVSPAAFRLRSPVPREGDALVRAWAATPDGDPPEAAALRHANAAAAQAVQAFAALDSRPGGFPTSTPAPSTTPPSTTAPPGTMPPNTSTSSPPPGAPSTTLPAGGGTASTAPAGPITAALALAARLVVAQPAVRVVHVNATGFDTHADQAPQQQRLLADFASGASGFFGALDQAGAGDRALLMTVSEFGRRVVPNGSNGTDHGKASVQFVMGRSVKPGVYGTLDLANVDDGDVRADVDPRSLYTIALDWLGVPVEAVLDRRYDTLGLLRA